MFLLILRLLILLLFFLLFFDFLLQSIDHFFESFDDGLFDRLGQFADLSFVEQLDDGLHVFSDGFYSLRKRDRRPFCSQQHQRLFSVNDNFLFVSRQISCSLQECLVVLVGFVQANGVLVNQQLLAEHFAETSFQSSQHQLSLFFSQLSQNLFQFFLSFDQLADRFVLVA